MSKNYWIFFSYRKYPICHYSNTGLSGTGVEQFSIQTILPTLFVKIKNTFEIFVNLALTTKIISAIPNKDITALKGRPINPINGIKGGYIDFVFLIFHLLSHSIYFYSDYFLKFKSLLLFSEP